MSWVDVGAFDALPDRGARVVRLGDVGIAVFRTSSGKVYALRDQCPHRGGPLSQGIVHGERVTCPLHDWVIDLASGQATGVDVGCTTVFNVRVRAGRVAIELPDELVRAPTPPAAEPFSAALDSRACAMLERA